MPNACVLILLRLCIRMGLSSNCAFYLESSGLLISIRSKSFSRCWYARLCWVRRGPSYWWNHSAICCYYTWSSSWPIYRRNRTNFRSTTRLYWVFVLVASKCLLVPISIDVSKPILILIIESLTNCSAFQMLGTLLVWYAQKLLI